MKQTKIKSRLIALAAIMLVSVATAFAQTSTTKHIVERGETLETIAQKYGVSKDEIVKLNPDAVQFVYVGMELVVPVKSGQTTVGNSMAQGTRPVVTSSSQEIYQQPQYTTSSSDDMTAEALSYLRILYQSDSEIWGIDYGADFSKYITGKFFDRCNLKFGSDETLYSLGGIAVGAKQRIKLGDAFLASIELTPYIGLGYSSTPKSASTDSEEKTTFEYGALGNITVGFKVCNTSKGNSTFLTASYEVAAGRFKTKGMFKYGYFSFGIITVVGN